MEGWAEWMERVSDCGDWTKPQISARSPDWLVRSDGAGMSFSNPKGAFRLQIFVLFWVMKTV